MRSAPLLAVVVALAACGSSPTVSDDPLDAGTTDTQPGAPADSTDVAPQPDVIAVSDVPDGVGVDVAPEDTAPIEDATVDVGAPEDTQPDLASDVAVEAGSGSFEERCDAACNAREVADMGFCEVGTAPCVETCVQQAPDVESALFAGYLQCIEDDPLCFQTMLQCVLSRALPDPYEHVVNVEASGFEDYVGRRLFMGIQEVPDSFTRFDTAIEAPEFALALEVIMSASQSHLVLWFVDVDGDGACSAEADVTGSASYDLWALDDTRIVLPDWRIPIAPDPDRNTAFVCDFL